MNLTAENTAIVLDSTSDFPEASKRFANMRIVPLYVNFGAESFRDHVDIGSHDFYERLKESPTLPTTSQPTPQDFLEVFEELGALRADLRAPAVGEAVRHVPVRVGRCCRGRWHRSASSTPRRRRSPSDCSRWRSSAASRGARPTTEIEDADRAVQAGERRRLHRRHARVPPEGRSHRPRPGARGHAAEREADHVGGRRRHPPDRKGAGSPEGPGGVRTRVRRLDGGSARAADRDRPRGCPGVGRRPHRTCGTNASAGGRSSSSRTSVRSSARTPARGRSASSGSRTSASATTTRGTAGCPKARVLYSPGVHRKHGNATSGRVRRGRGHPHAGRVRAARLDPSSSRRVSRRCRGSAQPCADAWRSSVCERSATSSLTAPGATSGRSTRRSIRDLFGDEEAVIEGVVLGTTSRRGRGRLKILTARVADDTGEIRATWFNQPWLEAQLHAGHARAPARKAEPLRLPGRELRPRRGHRDRRLRARLPRERGAGPEAAARARRRRRWSTCGQAGTRCRRRSPWPSACRCAPTRWSHFIGRAHWRRPRQDGGASPSTSSSSSSSRLHGARPNASSSWPRRCRPPAISSPAIGRCSPSRSPTRRSGRSPRSTATSRVRPRCSGCCRATSAPARRSSRLATLLRAVEAGRQGALMAPTEVLAEQHFLTIEGICTELGVRVALLTSALTAQGARERAPADRFG